MIDNKSKIMLNSENNLITICIAHFNDTDFVLNALYCLEKLTKNKYKVIIRDNNSKKHLYERLRSEIKNYKNVYLYKADNFNLKGSLAHSIAVNDLIQKIDTPYGVILDADCTFLIKNWDEILINQLDNEIKIIGTQAPVGSQKPQDFPLMFGILFETETLKRLNIDFRPKNVSIGQDTGWELREKYLNNGYKGKIIKMKNTRTYKQGPFRDIFCAEYYLNGYNHIFASHFGRGSSKGNSKYRKGTFPIYRLPIIGRFFRRMKGKREKNKWIEICKKIIDNQI